MVIFRGRPFDFGGRISSGSSSRPSRMRASGPGLVRYQNMNGRGRVASMTISSFAKISKALPVAAMLAVVACGGGQGNRI